MVSEPCTIGLYGHGTLELPFSGLVENFKFKSKAGDEPWTASLQAKMEAVKHAKSTLQHGNFMAKVQYGGGGLGLSQGRPLGRRQPNLISKSLFRWSSVRSTVRFVLLV